MLCEIECEKLETQFTAYLRDKNVRLKHLANVVEFVRRFPAFADVGL